MLVFWVFPEQLLSHIMLERLHCYEVTLVNKYYKPLLQKSETRIFDQTRFHKKQDFIKSTSTKKNSGVLRLNQIMSILSTVRKCLGFNYKQIQQLFAIVTLF